MAPPSARYAAALGKGREARGGGSGGVAGSKRPSGASSSGGSGPSKRSRKTTSKPSLRSRVIEEDQSLEEQIQTFHAPVSTQGSISTRQLSLRAQAKRDGHSFRLPSLTSLCLGVAAEYFGTHILPTIGGANGAGGGSKGKGKASASGSAAAKRRRIAEGGRVSWSSMAALRAAEAEEDASKDWVPSDDDDENVASSSTASSASSDVPLSRRAPIDIQPTTQDLIDIRSANHSFLKLLNDDLASRLQRELQSRSPSSLDLSTLDTYFVKGRSRIDLSSAMSSLASTSSNPAAQLLASYVPRPGGSTLTSLSLVGLTKLTDRSLCVFLRRAGKHLESVSIKGCVRVTEETVRALVDVAGKTLRDVDVSHTDVGAKGVGVVISGATNLEKLACDMVEGLDNKATRAILASAIAHGASSNPPFVPLRRLRHLSLRNTATEEEAVGQWLKLCRATLEHLDLRGIGGKRREGTGFDLLALELGIGVGDVAELGRRTADAATALADEAPTTIDRLLNLYQTDPSAYFSLYDASKPPLRFLGLTQRRSESVSNMDEGLKLLEALLLLPSQRLELQELHFEGLDGQPRTVEGALGRLERWSETLKEVKDEERPMRLKRLGVPDSASPSALAWLLDVVEAVCPDSLEALDRSNSNLEPAHEATLPLLNNVKHLSLSGCSLVGRYPSTAVGGKHRTDWSALLARGRLESIDLTDTTVEEEEVDDLIDLNPFLTELDLTGCRGVSVRERRRFFEAYEERKKRRSEGR